GITPPAVAKVEKNPMKASVATLERYAAACGVNLKISIV
ncbi:transcriptional regulator, partial [Photorhabdus tasmaniensis]|nr:transcriptional regulator [Photorhabdus tasmaniensis]NHB90539.1 transcriptional regulator [Photorhabdus tasmaniensis]